MIYRFGIFAFDDGPAILTRSDRPVALEPQPARALALLLARAGELVSREELRAHLWGADTHVDVDRGLAYCIGQLRTALGDAADNPRFVQTLPRRGFTFIAPVERQDGSASLSHDRSASLSHDRSASLSGERERGAERSAESLALHREREREPERSAESLALRRTLTFAAVLVVVAAVGTWIAMRQAPPPTRPIVAVAVFDNESGDPSHARAVAGLSDAIVERLTALGPNRLGVIGNSSVLRRPRADRDLNAIARDTNASFLVSGQLQNRDGRLSLLMQLIRLDDGTHVWVQRLSPPSGGEVDALDDDAARQVAEAVRRIVLHDPHVVLVDPRARG